MKIENKLPEILEEIVIYQILLNEIISRISEDLVEVVIIVPSYGNDESAVLLLKYDR